MARNKEHRNEAMQDPGEIYAVPGDVLKDDNLSLKNKRKVLKNWADEIERILDSEAENMNPEQGSPGEEELLKEITSALDDLNGQA